VYVVGNVSVAPRPEGVLLPSGNDVLVSFGDIRIGVERLLKDILEKVIVEKSIRSRGLKPLYWQIIFDIKTGLECPALGFGVARVLKRRIVARKIVVGCRILGIAVSIRLFSGTVPELSKQRLEIVIVARKA